MTTTTRAIGTAVLLSLVWAIAAAITPTSTYHLAPILVAGSVPLIAEASTTRMRARSLLSGAAIGLLTSLLLAVLDLLRGPTLLPYGGALAEAVAFVALGGVAGGFLARRFRSQQPGTV